MQAQLFGLPYLLSPNERIFIKEAQSLGIDASESKKRLIAELIKVQQSADKIGRSNINLDSLSTEQIESVVKEYQGLLQQLDKVFKETQKLRTELTVPAESDRNNLRDEMLIQSQLPQLKRAAKELGVKGIYKKDKAGIVDAILGSGADEETIRSKLLRT
ncbi:MAG: hypothetical protein C6Y22_05800 [Hapalosiphonaceae cyanobacterium JJU2]|nr:MAG: hypothetical protein C6Y22_05800 [Hapalosiphonaceae cyanobacterium JJU2]